MLPACKKEGILGAERNEAGHDAVDVRFRYGGQTAACPVTQMSISEHARLSTAEIDVGVPGVLLSRAQAAGLEER